MSEGFEAIPLPPNPLGCLKAFLEVVRQGDFDLVQERPFSKGIVRNGYGLAASLDRGLPLVTELHNIGAPLSYARRLPIHVPSLWHSSLILAYADLGRWMLFGASKEKAVIVPNGYSKELVDSIVSSREGQFDLDRLTKGRKAFGFFGGLTATKGVDLLLDVARKLRHREDVCFVFAGRGNLVDRIRDAAREPGSNVVYLGILNRYDALSCMSQCESTFAVYDPLQSAVGNPVKIVESIALGVPVIVNEDLIVPDRLRPHCIVIRDRFTKTVAEAVIQVAESCSHLQIPSDIEDFSIESISERIVLPAYVKLLEKAGR